MIAIIVKNYILSSMNAKHWLRSQPEGDVRAAMEEEGCVRCFGCPHATVVASVLSQTATTMQAEVSSMIESNELKFHVDPDGTISKILSPFDALQTEYKRELTKLTSPCVGWMDGVGGKQAPRPANMCNSPESGDYKFSIAAGWLLEKLMFFRTR